MFQPEQITRAARSDAPDRGKDADWWRVDVGEDEHGWVSAANLDLDDAGVVAQLNDLVRDRGFDALRADC
jgi:hypothetical protein